MDELIFVRPSGVWQQQIADYRREFEASGDSIDGSGGLKTAHSLEDWLKAQDENTREETVRGGFVPATTFLGVRASDSRLVGMVNIRHRLNDGLLVTGGHIGYSVRPSERRRGYAVQLLGMALGECRRLGIEKALVTCYKDNIASARTIQRCGGVLENEIVKDGRAVQRYWIAVE